jgi:tetratricopeptide (TPR) repeat protein
MDENLRGQIKNELALRQTEDLVAIWQEQNTNEYEPETFFLIQEILQERLGYIPDVSVKSILPRIFEKIDTLLEKKEYESGLLECESALRLAPDSAEAYNYRGLMYDYLGDPEKAIADYRHAIRLDPNFTDARENLAELQKEYTNQVMARISESSQFSSEDEKTGSYIRQYFEPMETDELVRIWKAHDTDEWTEEAFVVLQEILISRLGSVPEISVLPPLHKIMDNIRILRQNEDYAAAQIECERAVEAAPDSPKANYLLGLTLEDLGEWEKAAIVYAKAVELNPEMTDAVEGFKYANHMLDEQFKNAPASEHLRLAMEYAEDEDFELAMREIELAKSMLPEVASSYNVYGEALLAVRHPDEAFEAFERALQLNPDYSRARTGLRNAKVMQDELPLHTDIPIDPADEVEVEKQAAEFDEKAFEKQQDKLEETPGWVYMNKDALLVRGTSGHRNRPGRSGLDPMDTQMDAYRFEGGLVRKLFTGHMRTKDPLYLTGMIIIGLILSLPAVYLFGSMTDPSTLNNSSLTCLYVPAAIPGLALLINAGLSLISEEPDDTWHDGSKFF